MKQGRETVHRRLAVLLAGTFFALGVAGCDRGKTKPAAEAHAPHAVTADPAWPGFKPAKLLPVKTVPRAARPEGEHSFILGKPVRLAQTFTVTATGQLTGFDIGLDELADSHGPMLLDVCRTRDGEPVDDPDNILLSVAVPHAMQRASYNGAPSKREPVTGIDLSAFNLRVNKGEVLAVAVRNSEGGSYSFGLVTGRTYPGGQCFTRWATTPWKLQQPLANLYFRCYVREGSGAAESTSRPATGYTRVPATGPAGEAVVFSPDSRTGRGTVIAEATPLPQAAAASPATRPAVSPHVPAPLQLAARMFQSEDQWYLEVSQFNGSDRPTTISPHPGGIEAARVGEAIPRPIVLAPDVRGFTAFSITVGPNEGYIKSFPIAQPLPPGRYALSLHRTPGGIASPAGQGQCWLTVADEAGNLP